ncbi:GtrA family protein [Conexibacter stalactiti]|uniref:GtrA family protein n=1 Tax=Conexibacter stalactiti TaxID=1940611 RepID=A0ABU4HJ35_9ACTN|nr:GtrA family protein [Conexibacter stalactiti]MDW5593265.1 GtrA family protein [Conexibacter stalactiti]MEC5033906.1 GtrA family protein [Conexibacter stalactiti]
MPKDTTVVASPLHRRVRHGMRHPRNWFQLVRFGLVGASGYVVNLAVFTLAVHSFEIGYRIASVLAFLVSVLNNFWWNRHWTFDGRGGHAGFQAARFLLVSVIAFGFNYAVLVTLVEVGGLPEVPAQAIAIVAATPLNFLGQKLWSFRR